MSDRVSYKIRMRVAHVEEKFQKGNYHLDENQKWACDSISLGWFVRFEKSWESIPFGPEKPVLVNGQSVTVTIDGD